MIYFLLKTEIIYINKKTIEIHGGNFIPPNNFLHEENLDYLIDIVESEMFGVELYPKIYDKAAVYFYNIICNHIFSDGNKRTGLEAALAFLKLNNYEISQSLKNEDILNFVIKVASGHSSLEECQLWFSQNVNYIDI